MGHPTEGVLRRLLDEPAGVANVDRQHVASCEECVRRVAAIRQDADLVHAALATGARADLDVDPAWQHLSAAASATGRARSATPRTGRVRAALRRPVVATVAVAVLVTGAGAAAANDWLQIFRTEQIAPLSLSAAERIAVRGEESNLDRRLGVHDSQLDHSWWYDFFVVNDDIEGFRANVERIGRVELARTAGARYLAQRWMDMDVTLGGSLLTPPSLR